MASSEAMTSSTCSFAYSYRLVKKCFVKICETSKCHNFLIFQPIFIRFSLFCSQNVTLSSEIKLTLFRSSPLTKLFFITSKWLKTCWYFARKPCNKTISSLKARFNNASIWKKYSEMNGPINDITFYEIVWKVIPENDVTVI